MFLFVFMAVGTYLACVPARFLDDRVADAANAVNFNLDHITILSERERERGKSRPQKAR